MKLAQVFNSKWFYRLIALFFAILLFLYVTSEKGNTTRNGDTDSVSNGLVSNKTVTISVPLKLNIDSDKYFVTGYPENVKVRLSGPSALVTTAKNTEDFEVYANLNNLKLGKHTVTLKSSGISSELTSKIIPKKIKIKISKRKTKKMAVQVRYDTNRIASNYAAGSASVSQKYVTVTGATKDINNIDKVVADVNLPRNTDSSYSKSVTLQALDENGKVLNVVISPTTVTATVPIYSATYSKKVGINLISGGDGVSGVSYSFSTSTQSVTIHGTKQALSKISKLNVPVFVTGITSSTTENVSVTSSQNGITSISPSTISVKVTVTDNNSSSSSTTSSNSATNKTTATSSVSNSQVESSEKASTSSSSDASNSATSSSTTSSSTEKNNTDN